MWTSTRPPALSSLWSTWREPQAWVWSIMVASTQNLLLVEDHVLIRNGLRDALTGAGYEVARASDGTKTFRRRARSGTGWLESRSPRLRALTPYSGRLYYWPKRPRLACQGRAQQPDDIQAFRRRANRGGHLHSAGSGRRLQRRPRDPRLRLRRSRRADSLSPRLQILEGSGAGFGWSRRPSELTRPSKG
jgi:hypothetical protein